MKLKVYALQYPDGSYHAGRRANWCSPSKREELHINCLFASPSSLRQSWGGKVVPNSNYAKAIGWYPLRTDAGGMIWDNTDRNNNYKRNRVLSRGKKALSTDEFYELLAKDGYILKEFELEM